MKNLLIAAGVSLVALATSLGSVSAADLVRYRTYTNEIVVAAPAFNPWTVSLGGSVTANGIGGLNTRTGYFFTPNFGVEASYDYLFSGRGRRDTHFGSFNPVASFNLTDDLRAYGLAGAGYLSDWRGDRAAWNVGAGLAFAVSRGVELDARYRYVRAFDGRSEYHVGTAGVNFRF